MPELPPEILNSLQNAPGFDREAFVDAHQEPACISVRRNPFKPAEPAFTLSSQVPWCIDGHYLAERPSFTHDPLFHCGCYYVQEPGSMFLQTALENAIAGIRSPKILDLCAAPGGKSTLLLSLLSQKGLLVSNEIVKSRIPALTYNLSKWGNNNSIVTNNEPARFAQLEGFFDAIIIDAPCSGSGLFRKQPEAIHEWSELAVQQCGRRQRQILTDALPSLKPGGYLFYSTCSFSVDENENIVKWLMDALGFELQNVGTHSDWGIFDSGLGYRFYPDKTRSEGFYCALLRKPAEILGRGPKTKPVSRAGAAQKQLLQPFLDETEGVFLNLGDRLHFVHPDALEFLGIAQNFYLRKAGIMVGEVKGKDLVPSHELALSVHLKKDVKSCALDMENALRFLKKENLDLPDQSQGLRLMTYSGYGLGWAKLLGTRINNYLSSELRILR